MNKSNHPEISIIIPIYNREDTLAHCLDSVKSQTFQDWEALLVDDGSTDGSGVICDEYADSDQRFRAIHLVNGGASKARQEGVNQAEGTFVIHIDSDDWVESDMLQSMHDKAVSEQADIVICDFIEENNGKSRLCKQCPNSLDADEILKEMLLQQLHGSCCNKLVRRVCYNAANVSFPEGVNIFEDLFVTCQLLRNHPKVSYLPCAFYHYIIGQCEDNLTKRISLKGVNEKMQFVRLMSKQQFTTEHEELFLFKKDVLVDLFLLKEYRKMYDTYPEIHSRIVAEKKGFNVFTPYRYVLAHALKGYVLYANLLLRISYGLIRIKKLIS